MGRIFRLLHSSIKGSSCLEEVHAKASNPSSLAADICRGKKNCEDQAAVIFIGFMNDGLMLFVFVLFACAIFSF